MREIEEIAIQLYEVVKLPSGGLNGRLEVLKYLLKLCSAVVFAYDVVARISPFPRAEFGRAAVPTVVTRYTE